MTRWLVEGRQRLLARRFDPLTPRSEILGTTLICDRTIGILGGSVRSFFWHSHVSRLTSVWVSIAQLDVASRPVDDPNAVFSKDLDDLDTIERRVRHERHSLQKVREVNHGIDSFRIDTEVPQDGGLCIGIESWIVALV